MNTEQNLAGHFAEELLECLLARMRPGLDSPAKNSRPGWWGRDLAIALLVGGLAGLVFYQFRAEAPALSPNRARLGQEPTSAMQAATEHAAASEDRLPIQAEPVFEQEDDFQETPPEAGPEAVARAAIVTQPNRSHQSRTRPPRHNTYQALISKGWRLYSRTSYHASSISFGRAVHLEPMKTDGYYGLALCMFEQGREDMAMWVLDRGLEKTGPKADLWVLAGSIHQWQGREPEARQAYESYLKHNPEGQHAPELRTILAHSHLPKLEPYYHGN